jgi:hypothetical protein
MTVAQLEQRVKALEESFHCLQKRLDSLAEGKQPWWREHAGQFADDPEFDEIIRLGREYRRSQPLLSDEEEP